MKRFSGNTLVEVLMALCVLGIVVPASLGALGSVLMADLKVHESAYMVSSAEWWFSRLESPVRRAGIDAAPKVDGHSKIRFDWETEDLHNGAIRVTLRVHGRLSGSLLTVSRVY